MKPGKGTAKPPARKAAGVDFRDSVENAVHGVLIHRNFKPLYANAACAKLFGFADAASLGALPLIRPLIPPDNWARAEAGYAALQTGQGKGVTRQRMLDAEGQEIWLAQTERAIVWDGKAAAEWHLFDISDQMRGEQQLQASEQRLRAILEVLPYPIMIARQHDGQVQFVNRKTCLLLAQSAGALLKRKAFDFFVDPQDRDHFLTMLDAVREVRELEVTLAAHDGRKFQAEIAAITIDYGGQNALLLAFADISARKQLEAELFHEASTDALTGVINRRYFMNRAEQELRRARRFARDFSVMMIDLDHFKQVNDTHGHAGGDLVLQQAVKACADTLRATDTLGRLGGEEFALLMPETDLQRAVEVADRLRQRVEALQIQFGGKAITCTVSVGVAALQPQDGNIDALLQRADQALYLAKQGGRNRVVGAE